MRTILTGMIIVALGLSVQGCKNPVAGNSFAFSVPILSKQDVRVTNVITSSVRQVSETKGNKLSDLIPSPFGKRKPNILQQEGREAELKREAQVARAPKSKAMVQPLLIPTTPVASPKPTPLFEKKMRWNGLKTDTKAWLEFDVGRRTTGYKDGSVEWYNPGPRPSRGAARPGDWVRRLPNGDLELLMGD